MSEPSPQFVIKGTPQYLVEGRRDNGGPTRLGLRIRVEKKLRNKTFEVKEHLFLRMPEFITIWREYGWTDRVMDRSPEEVFPELDLNIGVLKPKKVKPMGSMDSGDTYIFTLKNAKPISVCFCHDIDHCPKCKEGWETLDDNERIWSTPFGGSRHTYEVFDSPTQRYCPMCGSVSSVWTKNDLYHLWTQKAPGVKFKKDPPKHPRLPGLYTEIDYWPEDNERVDIITDPRLAASLWYLLKKQPVKWARPKMPKGVYTHYTRAKEWEKKLSQTTEGTPAVKQHQARSKGG